MAAINAQALYANVTTENYVRRVQNINPNRFSQTVLQISDQQSRDKNYEKGLEYIRTYIASLQAKINSLVEELNTLYENTLTETLFRRADSKNTAKKVNKLTNATSATGDNVSSSLKDAGGRTGVVQSGYDGETRMFSYNPFFGTRSADLSNYYNLLANNDVSAARAYYQNSDNTNHELGASALGTIGYLWLWDVDRITTSYATTMDKYIDQNGIMHLPTNDPLLTANNVKPGGFYPPKPMRSSYANGTAGDAAFNTAIANWEPLVMSDPAMNIVGTGSGIDATNKLQVNITALQPNRGIVDLAGIDAPKKIIPIPDLSKLGTYQAGNISYANGSGYSFNKPPGDQLFFDTEKWAIVDANGNTPKMEVISKVTLEKPPVDSFGPTYNGLTGYGQVYGTAAGGWTNLTVDDNGNQRSILGVGGQLWDSAGRTGQNGVHQVDLEKKITFVDDLLKYPSEPGAVYTGSGGGDDGYALYIKNAAGGTSSTGITYNSNVYSPNSPWTLIRAVAGPAGINYTNSSIQATQEMYLHVAGNTSGWAGGSDGGAYIYGDFSISARTVGDTVEVDRYYVDESGKIFDRFGTGSNSSYGHYGGSFQKSNSVNPAPVNNVANGYDDYNLYDYVPNLDNPALTSNANIPDITNGDFFYYREALNSNENTTNLNRPNITFDPRRMNIDGKLAVTNNRVEIKNTDFAMFADTHLTYVEQNQDLFNQTKKNTFVSWVGLSDKDLVANNESKSNSEKDYLMKLNFENKDENGTGILSAVTRVHVKAVGEPTVQVKVTEEWDSVKWVNKPVKTDTISGWQEDTSTPANSELTVSGTNFSVTTPISTLVTPGYWAANGSKTVYTNQPWSNDVVKIPNLDVQPDKLASISGSFTVNRSGAYNISGQSGDMVVTTQYFDQNANDWVSFGNTCNDYGCSGTHSAWGGTFNFNLNAPPAFDGMKLRINATFDPGGVSAGGPPFTFALDGNMNLQANKEKFVPPVYADKTVTRDIESGSSSMAGYRDGKLKIYDTQTSVPGANVERLVQFSTDGGNTWSILASNLPAGNPTIVDIPASVTGNVSFRCVTNVIVPASPNNTPAVPGVWNITKMELVAQPIPENPKTLGLEMTKGYYKGIEQTGNGTIINPLSDTQGGYVKQDFYTDIDGVAGFNMYLNKDEYNALLRKSALVNDATLQVEIEYLEDTDQNGRIEGTELTNIKKKFIGVDDATRFQTTAQNRVAADTSITQADKIYSNILVAGSGRSGGADAKTQNENKFTKRLKQVIDGQEWQEVMKYGLLEDIYIAATTSDNRGDQITGKLRLNWDWRRRYIDVTQGSFTAIYKA